MLEHLPVISSFGLQIGRSIYVFDHLDERNTMVKSILYFENFIK
jgi:hypothetical protein